MQHGGLLEIENFLEHERSALHKAHELELQRFQASRVQGVFRS